MWYLDLLSPDHEAVPGHGTGSRLGSSQWAIVFGAPGSSRPNRNEVAGPATLALLNKHLPEAVRESLYLTTLVKQPQNLKKKKLPRRLVRGFAQTLMDELALVKPDRILCVGSEVADILCPGFQDITEDHGVLFTNPVLNALVVPTYQFSATAYQPQLREVVSRDIYRWLTLSLPKLPPYQVITDLREVPWRKDQYVLDIETTGFDPRADRILSVGFKAYQSDLVYIWKSPTRQNLADLYYDGFKPYASEIIGHNLQFDLEWLMELTNEFWDIPIVDTMLMAHNSGEESLKLKHLTTMHTNRPGSHAFGRFEDEGYLAEDVLSTQAVYDHFKSIKRTYIHRLVNRIIPVAAEIRWKGVPIDYDRLVQLKDSHEEVLVKTKADLEACLPAKLRGTINWNSPEQVVMALQKSGVKLSEKTDHGAFTVKESVLLGLKDKHPIVVKLLEYREQDKLREFLETYSQKLGEEIKLSQKKRIRRPRLHPRMKIHGTKTGRTAMEDPNLQQVTRTGPLKTMFCSSFTDGIIGLVDLSQAELRAACLLSGDVAFAKALLSDDVHRTIASIIYQVPPDEITPYQRKKSKGITFGLLYGGGAKGLAARLGIDVTEVEKVIFTIFNQFPGLNRYIRETKSKAIRERRIVDHFGRIRDLSTLIEINGENDARRKAINTPIQGLASHMALLIMGFCFYKFRQLRLYSRVLFGVHDSTILDVHPKEKEIVAKVVQEAFESLNHTPLNTLSLWGKLPIVGELIFGKTWAAVESTNENYSPEKTIPVSSHPQTDLSGGRKHE